MTWTFTRQSNGTYKWHKREDETRKLLDESRLIFNGLFKTDKKTLTKKGYERNLQARNDCIADAVLNGYTI